MAENSGNSVGSRDFVALTPEQKALIIGCVLGDGHLRKLEGRKHALLEINHSYKAKDYVDWKYKLLKNIVKSPPKQRRYGNRIAYRFTTRQHPYLTKLHNQFYQGRKKVIPKGFTLTPLSLAVWFMDDGSCTQKGDVYLNSQQFDLQSQRRLLHALRQLGIRARLNKDKKYYRIRILKESLPRFWEVVAPYIHPSMEYKLKRCKKATSP